MNYSSFLGKKVKVIGSCDECIHEFDVCPFLNKIGIALCLDFVLKNNILIGVYTISDFEAVHGVKLCNRFETTNLYMIGENTKLYSTNSRFKKFIETIEKRLK